MLANAEMNPQIQVATTQGKTRPQQGAPGICLLLFVGALSCLLGSGCHHRSSSYIPPPPPETLETPKTLPQSTVKHPRPEPIPVQTSSGVVSDEDLDFVASHRPIYSEEGVASWYGPPYNNHRGANGQIFDQNAMTAAHRTLPMNSLVKVTNLSTGQAAVVRITDRGPFIPGRLLDLSLASAKTIGVWRAGLAQVRVDVYDAPKPIEEGGRWCVQIGAFRDEEESLRLKDHLLKKYSTANVIEFTGPTGHWVRIRPLNDDKARAEEIARALKPSEGAAFLVRLD
jgi:rare lipoprotein A